MILTAHVPLSPLVVAQPRRSKQRLGHPAQEIHWRVKGTEKFWPQKTGTGPTGATPILALQAAALSEDARLESLFA